MKFFINNPFLIINLLNIKIYKIYLSRHIHQYISLFPFNYKYIQ